MQVSSSSRYDFYYVPIYLLTKDFEKELLEEDRCRYIVEQM